MITIDGSIGEGGGQIFRTALALSLVSEQPFRITNLRGGRKKPGLLRQHLTALNAAAEIGNGVADGGEVGSTDVTFKPGTITPGHYHVAVGTAGSATLVLQSILPALLTASAPTTLVLEGGTHNPYAPPFDFLAKAFLPFIRKMGPTVTVTLERPGFYPAGGGKFTVDIQPVQTLTPVDLMERGGVIGKEATAMVSQLPGMVGERELHVIKKGLSLEDDDLKLVEVASPRGPGNIVMVAVESEHVTEVFTGFGERGVRAERVANSVVKPVREYLAADVPVGRYLADQLMIPMALAGGGQFMTLSLTRHATTNAEVLAMFLDVDVAVTPDDRHTCHVMINRK